MLQRRHSHQRSHGLNDFAAKLPDKTPMMHARDPSDEGEPIESHPHSHTAHYVGRMKVDLSLPPGRVAAIEQVFIDR